MCPLRPVVVAACPDASDMSPAVPELVVPVLNCNLPLTPLVPASTVMTITWPLLLVLPAPAVMLIVPPEVSLVIPATTPMSPPAP